MVGSGVEVGSGVAVSVGDGSGVGVWVAVGSGSGVSVNRGSGVAVGVGVPVDLAVAVRVAVGVVAGTNNDGSIHDGGGSFREAMDAPSSSRTVRETATLPTVKVRSAGLAYPAGVKVWTRM
jgi:hypothetical protein